MPVAAKAKATHQNPLAIRFVMIMFRGGTDCDNPIGSIMIRLLSPNSHLDSSPAK